MGLVGAGLATEIRHRRELAADPLQALLSNPLTGEPLPVVSADGTLIHAEVFGRSEAATIVLVPGWTETLEVYDLLTRGLLDRGFRVVGFDLRGQGRSGAPAGGDQSIERYGEDVEAVLASAGADRDDVIIAGHSMGGMSIMAWARAFEASARVRAAALINTGAAALVDRSTLLPAAVPAELRREIGKTFVLGGSPPPPVSTPLSRAILKYLAFGPTASAAQVAFMERMTWECPAAVRIGAGSTLGSLDVLAGAARLNVPTLVVAGDRDRMTPPALASQIHETLPEPVELLVLAQTGHMSPLERPRELAGALATLAERVGLTGTQPAPAGA